MWCCVEGLCDATLHWNVGKQPVTPCHIRGKYVLNKTGVETTNLAITQLVMIDVDNFLIIKPTICTNFTNLFWHETLHVSDSSSVHHQEFIHCTLSNGISHTGFLDSFRAGPARKLSTNLLSVQWINSWWWTEELSETCRVSRQNKFVKLAHLVGFIIKKFVTMHGHTNVKKKENMWKMFMLYI